MREDASVGKRHVGDSRQRFWSGFAAGLALLATVAGVSGSRPARAQGTKADYARAAGLRQSTQGKVLNANFRANFVDDGRFWYVREQASGKTEFILVDPTRASKASAFDHAKMAAALSKALNARVDAEKLPIDRLAFPRNGVVRVTSRDKSFDIDLATFAATAVTDSGGRAAPMLPSELGSSDSTGDETTLTFVNRTAETISLFWIDAEGAAKPYGALAPGESRPMHTYAGHKWLVRRPTGAPLVGFRAGDTPATAVIEPRTSGAAPRRPRGGNISPDGKWRAFARASNVVLQEVASGVETIITSDGAADNAYDNDIRWSPDSSHFAVEKVAAAQVRKVTLVESSPTDQEQPKTRTLDYPKPGDRVAKPVVYLVDVAGKSAHAVPDTLYPNPFSLMEEQWSPDGREFWFLYNERGHQRMRWIAVDAQTHAARTVLDETSATFIDWTEKTWMMPVPGGHDALWMSERDGYNHLYRIDTATGQVKNAVTSGAWVLRGVERVDTQKGVVYFRACGNIPGQDPYYIHYGRVNVDGTGLTWLTQADGTHKITYSPDNAFYVDTYSRVDLPTVSELHRASDGKKVLELEAGDASALYATGWKAPERFVAKGRDGKTDIYGVIWKPTNFDPSKKYPVIENIYAGPQDSFVPKAWASYYGNQEIAELGFIVVQIDGMGTDNRGKAFHSVCWHNIVDAGFPDRILWMKAAASTRPWLDITRVGLYGTSAGGQNALGGLLTHPEFYKAGVADCGCHDNRMDKMWWNEQWMGYPIGPHYAAQSNVTLAPNLSGKLLLMVGEMDTNVDPSSTFQVANALIRAGKDFDYLVAPGVGHGVLGLPYARHRMHDFFVRNLLGVEPRSR